MRIRDATILLSAGALGLAGCGGAGRTATTTRVASNGPTSQGAPAAATGGSTPSTSATSGGSTPSTTATSGGSTTPARRSAASKPARTAPTPDQRPHWSRAARPPRRRSSAGFDPNAIQEAVAKVKAEQKRQPPAALSIPPVPAAQPSGSRTAAVACMHYGGLYNVARHGRGTWVGTDPSNAQRLYVTGPYQKASVASGIAKSLAGRESARSGGLYIAFATFRSALSGELRTISGCLAHGGPKRTLVF